MALSIPLRWRVRLVVLGLLTVVALIPFQGIIWDGGFESAEYRLRFVDGAGRGVPGVTLRVLTAAGGECHLYPVNEFLPDSTPTSDADGRMVLHHAAHGLEFSGTGHRNLVGVRFGEVRAPQYALVFALEDREVYRTWYDDLCPREREGCERVARAPRAPRPWEWPARERLAHPGDASTACRLRLFDGDRNGVLDREERTAAGYFERVLFERDDDARQDITFLVVEQTIPIARPE